MDQTVNSYFTRIVNPSRTVDCGLEVKTPIGEYTGLYFSRSGKISHISEVYKSWNEYLYFNFVIGESGECVTFFGSFRDKALRSAIKEFNLIRKNRWSF